MKAKWTSGLPGGFPLQGRGHPLAAARAEEMWSGSGGVCGTRRSPIGELQYSALLSKLCGLHRCAEAGAKLRARVEQKRRSPWREI